MLNTLQSFGQKKSKTALRKSLRFNALISAGLGAVSIYFGQYGDMTDFGSGFLFGMAIALMAGSLYFLVLTSQDKAFNRYYVTYYDERQKQIRGLSLQLTLTLVVILLVALISLYAFWQIKLPYLTLMITLLYTIFLGRVFITVILNKLI